MVQEFRSSGVQGVQGVQEFRSSGVQEFRSSRSSGVQEFRSSGVQEFRSSGVQEFRSSRSSGVQGFKEFRSSRSSGVQEFRSSGVQEFRSSGVQWGAAHKIARKRASYPLDVRFSQRFQWQTPELLQLLELLNSYLFSLSCRSSCRQVSGMVVMFFLMTYQTAEATITDISFARQFSTKKRLTVVFMAIIQTVSDWASPLA
jgi:hypothetical protein